MCAGDKKTVLTMIHATHPCPPHQHQHHHHHQTCDRLYNLHGVGFLNLGDYDGRTALHLAAAEGQVWIIKMFINYGVDVEPRDRWGSTPLDEATNAEIRRLLAFHAPVRASRGGEGGRGSGESKSDARRA